MIRLVDVVRYHDTPTGLDVLLSGITAQFSRSDRVGIVAGPSSGKSTLARILAKIERPDRGVVQHFGRVSWPIGFSGGFHAALSGADNIAITARLMGQSPARVIAFCKDFTGLDDEIDRIGMVLPPAVRAKLGFALSMAIPFDMYVSDENLGVGDAEFRDRCTKALDKRLQNAGLVFLSRSATYVDRVCNKFLALTDGQLVECHSGKQAEEVVKAALATKQKGRAHV